jgi:hypothetical protein
MKEEDDLKFYANPSDEAKLFYTNTRPCHAHVYGSPEPGSSLSVLLSLMPLTGNPPMSPEHNES